MYTCCPNCASVYQLSAALLAEATGRARCGECRHVYNVFDALFDDLVEVREARNESRRTAPAADYVVEQEVPEAATAQEERDVAAIEFPSAAWQQQSLRSKDYLGLGGILLLLCLLGMQWLWFNRVALAAEPAWRPRMELLCSVLACRLPLPSEPAQLVLLSREVRRHPDMSGALQITAVFENRASFVQRFPVFEVSFTDSAGVAVAQRRFQPTEYLQPDSDIAAGLPAGARANVMLDVLDPGESASSFQFEFL
jgi:predicted Zn finger-like uncharacterized protein